MNPQLGKKRNSYDWKQIAEWRKDLGLSYNGIILKCKKEWGRAPAKSTISHHFSATTAARTHNRRVEYRKTLRGKIGHQVDHYRVKKIENYIWEGNINSHNIRENIRIKLKGYKAKRMKDTNTTIFGIDDVIKHLTKNHGLNLQNKTAISALTGDTIDLTKEFHLDHWDNKKGNTLENMCILTREENMLKGSFDIKELIATCSKIIKHLS